MDFFEAMDGRHCYRGAYRQDKIPREHLTAIIRAGLNAPSGCNLQTTSIICVDDDALLDRVRALIPTKVGKTAPAIIFVLTNRRIAFGNTSFAVQDYSAAIENLLLAASALGYQSCWVEGDITDEDRIGWHMGQLLGVPDGWDLVCYLPIGIPAEEVTARKKKPCEERAWFNGFEKK